MTRHRGYERARDLIAAGTWTIHLDTGCITGKRGPIGYRTPAGYMHATVAFADQQTASLPIHRIIWEYAHGPIQESHLQINHVNGDKTDNRITNLELVSPSRNIRHARDNGLNPYTTPQKLTPKQVVEIRTTYAAGATQVALAEQYGISQSAISAIVRGQTWRHEPGPIQPSTRPRTPQRCRNCGMEPAKAQGRCHTCACYWRRTGKERPDQLAYNAWDRWLATTAL